MFALIWRELRPAVMMLLVFSLIAGAGYTFATTVLGQALFRAQSAGSMIIKDGKPVGSELIGQPFTAPKYFWSRPSATSPYAYNAASSGGSNYGPLNPAQADAVKQRVQALRSADKDNSAPVPVDLVTASASGLDPHITPAGADFQIKRVAQARKMDEAIVRKFVATFTEDRQYGVLGEPRVNVLKLNLALDEFDAKH